jgi:Domain of unknown function (DUF1931)
LNAVIGDETEARLPLIAGGVAFALAQTLTIVDPKMRNLSTRSGSAPPSGSSASSSEGLIP